MLDVLFDLVFIFLKSGKYVVFFGGKDSCYYYEGLVLVGWLFLEVFNVLKI